MLILLPPSETKRDGGDESRALDLAALSFPTLTRQRREAIAAVRRVSKSVSSATGALRLGPTQRFEIDRNRRLGSSPTLPAIDRYTGVLYDGLDAASLDTDARRFLFETVVIHSALFGLVGAGDPIPAYRFSHDSRVPGLSLGRHWRGTISAAIAQHPGLILDLRSEMYADLGPAPDRAVFLRVVTRDASGTRRALNHFNKKAKGELVRALARSGVQFGTADELVAWGSRAGWVFEVGAPGELDLVVETADR